MKPMICTYYEDLFHREDERKLIDLWQETWTRLGYRTVVLGGDLAKAHPLYDQIIEKAKALPTVNDPRYELACYLRWLALEQFSINSWEKIVATDYDVFPTYRFEGFPEHAGFAAFHEIPSCIMGWHQDFRRLIKVILEYQPEAGENHVSDMTISRKWHHLFDTHWLWTLCYGVEGWGHRPFVHFGNAYMPAGVKRVDLVKSLQRSNLIYIE
jgi:hypothetical protein